jgi:hypothetical protein
VPSLQCWFQSREQVKISWSQVRRVWGMLHCCHIVLWWEILDQKPPVCWSNVVTNKPTVSPTFWGAFPSDRIPKTTKDVDLCFFIHSNSSCKLYQRITQTFWSWYVKKCPYGFRSPPTLLLLSTCRKYIHAGKEAAAWVTPLTCAEV